MTKAKKCPRCGVITTFDRCTCGSITKLVTGYRLATKLSVDVTLTLRFDHDRQPFILIQNHPVRPASLSNPTTCYTRK